MKHDREEDPIDKDNGESDEMVSIVTLSNQIHPSLMAPDP